MSENQMGEFIAALRKSKGYTQQEVARQLGVSNKTVSSWETGASCPDISMLPVLAELYGVTCDELLRGRRTPSEGEASPVRRDKAIAHILRKHKMNIATACWISGGLAALGVILTMIIGYAAFESRIGFFIGLILLVASVVTAAVVCGRIRFSLGEEWLNAQAGKVVRSLDRAILWIVCANVAALGFILPHVVAEVHTGLAFNLYWICAQFVCAAVGFLLAVIIGLPIYIHRRKVSLRDINMEDATEKAVQEHSQAVAKNRLAGWRYRHIMLMVVLPFAIIAAVAVVFTVAYANYNYKRISYDSVFTLAENVGQPGGPFLEGGYTLVDEQQPQSQDETGAYEVKYLFKNFPEEWRGYYRTQDTADGTVVTIYKYRYLASTDDGEEQEVCEFYAYDPDWQGETVEVEGTIWYEENADLQTEKRIYVLVTGIASLPDVQNAMQGASSKIVLRWVAVGIWCVAVLSFAVTIPLCVRSDRAYVRRQKEQEG